MMKESSLRKASIIAVPELVYKKVSHLCSADVEASSGNPPTTGKCISCEMIQKYQWRSQKME